MKTYSEAEAGNLSRDRGYTGSSSKVIKAIWYLVEVDQKADIEALVKAFPEEDPKGSGPIVFARAIGAAKETLGMSAAKPSGGSTGKGASAAEGRRLSKKHRDHILRGLQMGADGDGLTAEQCQRLLSPPVKRRLSTREKAEALTQYLLARGIDPEEAFSQID
jgi:hypothetical protein